MLKNKLFTEDVFKISIKISAPFLLIFLCSTLAYSSSQSNLRPILEFDSDNTSVTEGQELKEQEIDFILSSSNNWFVARDDNGVIDLLSELDTTRIFSPEKHTIVQRQEYPIVPKELFFKKRVLVVPAYGNLPFRLKFLGAESVIGIDIDTVTITWQKARVIYGKNSNIRKYFADDMNDLSHMSELLRGLKNLVVENRDTSSSRMKGIEFLQGDLTKYLPVYDRAFDFVVVPYIFAVQNGITNIEGYETAFRELLRVTKLDGTILVMPARITSFRYEHVKQGIETFNLFSNWLERQDYITIAYSKPFLLDNLPGHCTGRYALIQHKMCVKKKKPVIKPTRSKSRCL